jgi:hypothetical protein
MQPSPALPTDLLDRFGEPEVVFGPNRRFQARSTVMGGVLVLLGLGFCLVWGASVLARWPPGGQLYLLLGALLMTIGAVAMTLPRQFPLIWVFVCPRGLVRARGEDWEAVEWAEVVRVEDATIPSRMVTIRQCRLVLAGGGEWGFLGTYVTDCRLLTEVLQRKLAKLDLHRAGAAGPDAAQDQADAR